MLAQRRILAVVPARGGSKGVPLKNIRPLGGLPLISWTAKTIQALPWIDRAVASTDHEDIARIAREWKLDVPFMRPPEISGDRIGNWDLLHHALVEMERQDGVTYDVVLMLQPTSPLRHPEDVERTARRLIDGSYDSVWTVSETDSKNHPLKQLVLQESGLGYYDQNGKSVIARQQLSTLYHRNGVCYAITRDCLVNQRSISGSRWGGVAVNGPHVSIDDLNDFSLVEYYMSAANGAPTHAG